MGWSDMYSIWDSLGEMVTLFSREESLPLTMFLFVLDFRELRRGSLATRGVSMTSLFVESPPIDPLLLVERDLCSTPSAIDRELGSPKSSPRGGLVGLRERARFGAMLPDELSWSMQGIWAEVVGRFPLATTVGTSAGFTAGGTAAASLAPGGTRGEAFAP